MTTTFSISSLGDVVSFRTGKLNSNAAKQDGDYPFFTCSQETFRTDTYSFDGEYVLLAGNNAAGVYPLKYFNGKFDAYQRTYAIQTKNQEKLTNRYCFYALRLQLELLRNISTGVATKFLTLTLLNTLKIPTPPLPTQKKIAAVLSAYDDLIENNERRIKILEEMAQNLYREWFVNFKFPGHEKVKMVDSPLGKIPQGWNTVKFGELYMTSSGGTPSRKVADYYGGTTPWVKTRELNDGFIFEAEEMITDLGLKESSAKLFPENTVLLAIYGATIGKLGILSMSAATNQACVAVLPKEAGFGRAFAFLFLRENRDKLIGLGQGAAQQNISQVVLKDFPALRSPASIAHAFSALTEPLLDCIRSLQKKNVKLRQTRDLLLPKLISGEVDVSELDIKQAI